MRILEGKGNLLKQSSKNRNINVNHIKNLKESMKQFGFLFSKPIQVDSDINIIDGHHRYYAAKDLEINYYYVIEPIKDIPRMIVAIDKGTQNWRLIDWINYWANANNKEYLEILHYIKAGFSPSLIVKMASSSNYIDTIRNGKFTITNKKFYYMISSIMEIIKVIPFVKFKAESAAVITICKEIEGFDLDLLIHKCKTFPSIWKRSTNVKDAIKEIEKIYNNRSRNKISFGKLYL
jgi:hypothetical protein